MANGRSLVADIGPGLAAFAQGDAIRRQREAGEADANRQAQIQQLVGQLIGGGGIVSPTGIERPHDGQQGGGLQGIGAGQPGAAPVVSGTTGVVFGKRQENALIRLASIDPALSKSISDIISAGDQRQIDQLQQQSEDGLRDATFVSGQPDFASKQRALTSLAEGAASRGEPLDRFIQLQNLSEPELDLELQKMKVMGTDIKTLVKASQPTAGDFAKAPGVITRREDGSVSFEIPVLNKETGEFENKVVPISGEVVSRLGETGAEQSFRLAGQAGQAAVNTLAAELETAPKIKGAEKRAAEKEQRTQGQIDRGIEAADTIPILSRSLELLDFVKTGGIDAASLRAKQFFGVEGADEAELSANLGKSVLSQLRETFGAAFTENEGNRLAKIEAGFGKSVAGNIRLLENAQKIAQRAADRGARAATRAGDTDAFNEIIDASTFKFGLPDQPGPTLTPPTQVGRFTVEAE